EVMSAFTGKDLLKGKKGIVFGVANDHSLAWACAKLAAEQGAQLAFTYQGEVLERRVKPLAESVNSPIVEPCDLTDDAQIEKFFARVKKEWGTIDFVIHAVAFANKEDLAGTFVDTSREGFRLALDVSCYTFVAVAREAAKIMKEGGSMITLTY